MASLVQTVSPAQLAAAADANASPEAAKVVSGVAELIVWRRRMSAVLVAVIACAFAIFLIMFARKQWTDPRTVATSGRITRVDCRGGARSCAVTVTLSNGETVLVDMSVSDARLGASVTVWRDPSRSLPAVVGMSGKVRAGLYALAAAGVAAVGAAISIFAYRQAAFAPMSLFGSSPIGVSQPFLNAFV